MSNEFYKLFFIELKELYNVELQLVEALPNMVSAASHEKLKEAFNTHLEETKNQVKRLEQAFSILKEVPAGNECEAMKGLIHEAQEIQAQNFPSAVSDAALIGIAQKVEHYEIASYGTARTFAKHLELEEIVDLLQESLNEEAHADKALTSIAEGGFFTSGINTLAASNT